jgi:hypothetical protein
MIILSFGTGCLTEQTKITDLRYNFHTGDEFTYGVESVTKIMDNIEDRKMNVKVKSLNSTVESITTKTEIEQITEGNETFSEYTTKMAQNGSIIEIISNDLIVPEIQPELPNTIIFPGTENHHGESWTTYINKEGIVNEPELLTTYNISGMTNYTRLGNKRISVTAGSFECAGIKSNTNYTLESEVNNTNRTFLFYTTGEIIGEVWVDINGGFPVKSTYDVDTITTTDLSENFKKMGAKKLYRETPMTSRVQSELLEKNRI